MSTLMSIKLPAITIIEDVSALIRQLHFFFQNQCFYVI